MWVEGAYMEVGGKTENQEKKKEGVEWPDAFVGWLGGETK
jgi:hypothetical protein